MNLNTLRQKREAKLGELEKMLEGDAPLIGEALKAYEAGFADVSDLNGQIARQEQFDAERAKSVTRPDQLTGNAHDDAAGKVVPYKLSDIPREELGLRFARMCRALSVDRDPRRAAEICERDFHDDSAAKALAAGSGTAGGFTVPENDRRELIEFLRPMSVIRSLGPISMPMPNGNITTPKQTGGATAYWVGENTNATPSEQTFGQLRLSARKLIALTPVSNDLMRFSDPSIDQIVRNDLAAAVAQAEDLAYIRGSGSASAPKGLRNWAPAANVLTVNATVNLANVTIDLGRLVLTLKQGNVRMIRPGWIMAPRTAHYLMTVETTTGAYAFRPEMLAGRLWGFPFRETNQIPINLAVTGTNESELYFADFADVVLGEVPGIVVQVSDTAAYHDGTNVVSSFSQDQSVIKLLIQTDFGMRHDASVAIHSDVDWGV